MMRPHFLCRIPPTTACVTKKTDFRFTARTSSHSVSVMSSNLRGWAIAAFDEDVDAPKIRLNLRDHTPQVGDD
jgi:hypothetical protein